MSGKNLCGSQQYPRLKGSQRAHFRTNSAKFLRVVLHYRKSASGPWLEYGKNFFYHNAGKARKRDGQQEHFVVVPLRPQINAQQIRAFLVCTEKPDPNALPMRFGGTARPDKSHSFPYIGNYATNDFRRVRVQVLQDTTSFEWNEAAKSAVKKQLKLTGNLDAMDVKRIRKSVNCTAINLDKELSSHFHKWKTPGDGAFVQDPDVNSPPIVVTKDNHFTKRFPKFRKWEVFVSKRRASFPLYSPLRLYDVEKRMLCVSNDALRSISNTAMTCCVTKKIYFVSSNPKELTSKVNNTAAADLRNF